MSTFPDEDIIEFAELEQDAQDNAKQNTFQKTLLRTLKSTTGQCPMVVVPRIVLQLCEGDLCRAIVLSHLIYLCDKGKRKDGFIYKSYREWKKETGLSQYEVGQATSWLKNKKHTLIRVDKKRIYGHPTMLYRLNQEQLVKSLSQILNKSSEDLAPELVKKARSKFLQGLLKN